MSYKINSNVVKSGKEYLDINSRVRFGTSLRSDIHKNLEEISKATNRPMSKCLDVAFAFILSDDELTKKYIKAIRNY